MPPLPASFLPLPSPAQLAWQETETNLFVHFGLNTFTGREWGDGRESPALFNPIHLDCRQWARTARAAGFKIGILTAKHHDGFCVWPTATTSHSVKSSSWREGRGDVVREFVDAFRAEGLKVGLYLSPWDRHEPCYGDSPRYNDFYCTQLTELLTRYGELHEVWFDGACAEGPNGRKQAYDWPRFLALVKQLQPGAVTFGDGGTDVRWVGNERGYAHETCWSTVDPRTVRFPGDSGNVQANDATARTELTRHLGSGDAPDPAGREPRVWRPAECDVSIRPGWFYHPEEDGKVRSVENLVELYCHSVGRNSLLLLNITPNPDGLFQANDIAAITGMRRELDRLFAEDLAQMQGVKWHSSSLRQERPDAPWAATDGTTQATIELTFPTAMTVNLLCLEEAIEHGQRIAAYRVETTTGPDTWQEIVRGTTIGRKKIDRLAIPVRTQRLRLTIESALAPPVLSAWRVF